MVDKEILTGKTTHHLETIDFSVQKVHLGIIENLYQLREAAAEKGFDLRVYSGFRGYEHQLRIWNAKAQGKRQLLDRKGEPLDYDKLSSEEVVRSILTWSAIPGASRHHWGTDFDVYDGKAMAEQEVQLTPQEVASTGPMGNFHQWLDEKISRGESFGFFRPYGEDRGGVAPEKWHLSYGPLSRKFLNEYTFEVFLEHLKTSEIELKEILVQNAQEFFDNYVHNVCD